MNKKMHKLKKYFSRYHAVHSAPKCDNRIPEEFDTALLLPYAAVCFVVMMSVVLGNVYG